MLNDYECIYLNSKRGESGTPSNFTCRIDLVGEYKYVSLIRASIPKSYNLVNSSNNRF